MISVFEHPWLGGLFGDEPAAALWSTDAQLAHYRAFEIALARALQSVGRVPNGQGDRAALALEAADLNIESLKRGTKHDGLPIPDLVRQLRDMAGEAKTAVHSGSTSQDVLDTALALTLKHTSALLAARLADLSAALDHLQRRFGARQVMGRTRMQAALPIEIGHRIQTWHNPLINHARTLADIRPRIERLQLGGPVGDRSTFGAHGDAIAKAMADDLGLSPTLPWHTDRSGLADYAGFLSALTGSLGKIGQDIALMAQQGLDDITLSGGGTSSAMPHKSNPILAELLVTLARFNAVQLSGMHHALIHEQERSGTAWPLEWMILPQMAMASARATSAALELLDQIEQMGAPSAAP